MQTKLTLRMDDKVIAKAKRIAHNRHQSISKIVEEHFKGIDDQQMKKLEELEIPEWIQKLGIKKRLKFKNLENDPKLQYLVEKHVKR